MEERKERKSEGLWTDTSSEADEATEVVTEEGVDNQPENPEVVSEVDEEDDQDDSSRVVTSAFLKAHHNSDLLHLESSDNDEE